METPHAADPAIGGSAVGRRFDLVGVAALGLGYLAQQVAWAIYNAYLPLLYGRYVASSGRIGLVMVLDNLAAVTLQPYFAAMSDRVRTRLGRRLPFLIAGMPLAALGFALIPRMPGLVPLLLATMLMNLGVALFASPSLALMPDITAPAYRSRANGLIMAMGGIGTLLAFFLLSPLSQVRMTLPFDAAAALMLAALVLIVLLMPEWRLGAVGSGDPGAPARGAPGADPGGAPARAARGDAPGPPGELRALRAAVRQAAAGPDRSPLWLLLAGVGWVGAVNGVQNMFTPYGVEYLGMDPAAATFQLGYVALAFIACAVPAGLAGERWGRLRVLRGGTAGLLAVFLLLWSNPGQNWLPVLFLAGGAAYALIISNAYPALVDRVSPERVGTFTGLWNTAIALGGFSPPLFGAVVDALGYGAFYLPGLALLALALLCILAISPEAPPRPAGAGIVG